MNPQTIRELTIKSFKEDIHQDREIVEKFKSFMDAYCAELKGTTEYEILNNDKLFNIVFGLFESVMTKHPEFY